MGRLVRLALVLAVGLAVLGAGDPTLRLGGVGIGTSVLDVVKTLGMPDAVSTTDHGQFWQWADANGLDREVYTDDDLIVQNVLVAPARSQSTAQPAELPMLGEEGSKAQQAIEALGAVSAHAGGASWSVWRWNGGVLVVETEASSVVRLRAFDERTATARGYFGPVAAPPEHRAPVLEKQYVPSHVPDGSGAVIVRVEIDAAGKVTDARVVVSSGDRAIDRFEVESMRHSTFAPASCEGAPCAGVYLDDGGVSR